MRFGDIIGQEEIKGRLLSMAESGNVPHAILLCGPDGCGKLELAHAFADYLLCDRHNGEDICGTCPACAKTAKMIHPDLHFVFPVVNKGTSQKASVSDDYMEQFRHFITEKPYGNYDEWLEQMDPTKQAQIFRSEGERILSKLSVKSSQGGYKIVLIWEPEKMNPTCSNSLLKILEEPPEQTLFLLVSDAPEQIIDTIISRCQRIDVPPLPENLIVSKLTEMYGNGEAGIDAQSAWQIAHSSGGSWTKAVNAVETRQESAEFLELFIKLMRLAYGRNVRELKTWSEEIASSGREWQKKFLIYCQHMVRENFIYNFGQSELIYMTDAERNFSQRFAPFINESNVIGLVEELESAQRHIEQNVNAKVVFFDLVLKLIVLLKH